MAEATGIAWTRSTFNPWIGCTEVSPGCDGCYARELDKRHRYGGAVHWGAGVPRHLTKTWKNPETWNRSCAWERQHHQIVEGSNWTGAPGFWPVFLSMCDPFDNEVDPLWRANFFDLILSTPYLTWLLLTKRVGNAERMFRPSWRENPPPNVWIGASIVNQEEADRDLPKLLATPAAKRFVSYEPALGPVDFTPFLAMQPFRLEQIKDGRPDVAHVAPSLIHQIIVGGESNQGKHQARPFNIEWARATRDACARARVAFFMKQTGSDHTALYERVQKDRAGADPAEWPEDLRVQEFPA